jgi:hypothetical protein
MNPRAKEHPSGAASPSPEKASERRRTPADPETKEHEGATEDQVTDTSPPSGTAYDDEPKQG